MNLYLSRFKTIFGIDLRTLALFRVALACVIIADLGSRAQDLAAHYTDYGILPRADLIGVFGQWRPSLHLAAGSATFEGVLFVVAGLIALALLVGYRTRMATVLSWMLLLSLQSRNEIISQGGDVLMLVLLFWAMFLPLGARFSVDAALDPRVGDEPNAYFSMATMALLIQCMLVYFFSALLKSGTAWIPDGTAVYYALHVDYFATPFAVWLRQFPAMMKSLTYFVWYLELIGPFLMFSPLYHVPLRLLLMALFIGMHVGFFLSLEIGIFPFVSIVSLLAFTPGGVWDRIEARIGTQERRGLAIYYDGPCEFCRKVCLILSSLLLLRNTPIRAAQDVPDIYQHMLAHNSWVVIDHDGSRRVRWEAVALLFSRSPIFWPFGKLFAAPLLLKIGDRIYEAVARNRSRLGELTAVLMPYRVRNIHPSFASNCVIAVLLMYVVYTNLTTLPEFGYRVPKSWDELGNALRLTQAWNMFTPAPPRDDGWYVMRGETRDGTPVDLWHGRLGEPDWTRPQSLAREYRNYRWRKYLIRVADDKPRGHRPYLARYLCRRWNAGKSPETQIVQVKLYFNLETIQPNYEPRVTKRLLFHVHQCQAPAVVPKASGLRNDIMQP